MVLLDTSVTSLLTSACVRRYVDLQIDILGISIVSTHLFQCIPFTLQFVYPSFEILLYGLGIVVFQWFAPLTTFLSI